MRRYIRGAATDVRVESVCQRSGEECWSSVIALRFDRIMMPNSLLELPALFTQRLCDISAMKPHLLQHLFSFPLNNNEARRRLHAVCDLS